MFLKLELRVFYMVVQMGSQPIMIFSESETPLPMNSFTLSPMENMVYFAEFYRTMVDFDLH